MPFPTVAALIAVAACFVAACSDADSDAAAPGTTTVPPTVPPPSLVDVVRSDPPSDTSPSRPTDAGSTTTVVVTTEAPAVHVTAQLDVRPQTLGFAGTQGLTGGLGTEEVVVTSDADGGPGTYREALESGGDRIVRFDPSLDGATIHLQSPVEAAGDNLTVDGSAADVTVSGHATRFSGTNIVVAGMSYRYNDDIDDDDALTFRDATRTQVVGLFGNHFETAGDGLVDLIWNGGHDVYVTMCGNSFLKHDKAVLIDSGDDALEGGTYHVTMCHNVWTDVYQRAPLSRRARIHQFNSLFERFGQADGQGGGSKAGGDGDDASQHLLENNIAVPRTEGDSTFDGSVVSSPRTEWAGPQLDSDSAVRIEGTLLETVGDVTATEVEQAPEQVFEPPYDYALVEATDELATVLRTTAGTCIPVRADRVSPCAPLALLEGSTSLDVLLDGDVAEVDDVRIRGSALDLPAHEVEPGRWRVEWPSGAVHAVQAIVTTSDGREVTSDVAVVADVP
jgi:pectate lyase